MIVCVSGMTQHEIRRIISKSHCGPHKKTTGNGPECDPVLADSHPLVWEGVGQEWEAYYDNPMTNNIYMKGNGNRNYLWFCCLDWLIQYTRIGKIKQAIIPRIINSSIFSSSENNITFSLTTYEYSPVFFQNTKILQKWIIGAVISFLHAGMF